MDNDFYNDAEEDREDGADFSGALELYRQACESGSEGELALSEEEYEYIIDYFIGQDDEAQVLKASTLAFEKHPYSSALLVKYADSLLVNSDVDKAVEILEEYENSFAGNIDIYFLLCKAFVKKGEFGRAREYFSQALEIDARPTDFTDLICSIAQDCIDADHYREALYYLMEADAIAPLFFEYYNDVAFCYERLEELDKALEYYNKYLDEDPFNDNVWFNIGTVYAKRKDFDKAIEAFEYSLALNESNSSSLYNIAVVFLNLERYRESVDFFRRFMLEEPGSVAGIVGMADAYLGLNDFTEAKKQFRQALLIDRECVDARLGIECIDAIEEYLKGEKSRFLAQMKDLAQKDSTWVSTVYTILPQLGSDGDFINLLKSIRKA